MKPAFSELCLAVVLLRLVALACAPGGAPGSAFGPRHPVGPDVPLSESETAAFARRVTVEGRTASAIQSACDQAVKEGVRVVFLPAGQYQFETTVLVPAGLTLLGDGAGTVCLAGSRSTQLFVAAGDRIRFTRMKLQGADTTWNDTNGSVGISVPARRNIRVDHCELLGFMRATDFSQEATAQVDHCSIHHNLRNGYGYGLVILEGAYVLATDNEFSQNRLSLTSNGALDWDNGPREGVYRHIPGVRKTHWEFRYNRISGNSLAQVHLPQVETHPGMDGTYVAEGNLIENVQAALGLRDGSGLIRGNAFRDLTGPQPAIWIITDTHNGVPVENAIPHDVQVLENSFQNVVERYRIGAVINIQIDGEVVPSTLKGDAPPPPAIPALQEMGEDGILRWKPARP